MAEVALSIEQLRRMIDVVDGEILGFLNTRAYLVLEIQKSKSALGLPSYSPERESQILAELRSANRGPLPDEAVEDIFRTVLRHSLASLRLDEDMVHE